MKNKITDPNSFMTAQGQRTVRAFATMAHPLALVVVDNDYNSDEYVTLHELVYGVDYSEGLALTGEDVGCLVYYCSDDNARANLAEMVAELNMRSHLFV